MICSATFYKSEEDVERPAVAKIGPFTITMQELFVSCITLAIVFPITIFVTFTFRFSNQKEERKVKNKNKKTSSKDGYIELDDIDVILGEVYIESLNNEQDLETDKKCKESRLKHYLGNGLLIAAWTVANLAIFLSAFFVILYSMEWGAKKSNSWLLSYLLSFIYNAFLADPIKVKFKSLSSLIMFYLAFLMFNGQTKKI